jgi:hypothetical protein
MHSAGLRCSKVNGNPPDKAFRPKAGSPLGDFSVNILCSDCTRTSAALAMRRIIPGAVGGMLQGAPMGEAVLAQAAYRTRQRVSGAGIIVRFYARPPYWPGRGCHDLRLRSPCSADPGKPPRMGRAIPRTSPLAETRSWTPPEAHPRSAAAETCLGAPESWVLEDYHEPAAFSYRWRPFSPASCRYRRSWDPGLPAQKAVCVPE